MTGEGVVAALALATPGVKIIATRPEESLTSRADAVEKMIDSISFDPAAAALMAAATSAGAGDALARRDGPGPRAGSAVRFCPAAQPVLLGLPRPRRRVGLVHLVRYFGPGSGVVGTGLAAGTIAVALYGLLFLASCG